VESILKDLSSDPEEEIDQIIVNLKRLDEKIWNLVKSFSLESIIKSIKNDLKDFNVDFDSWFNESSLGELNDILLRFLNQ
jgi:arginyl-tRNA synthetase